MKLRTVEDIPVKGKKVLVRCDFNVPMDDNGNITNDNRIVGALPTISYLVKQGAKVILCSHMGRPKGEFNMKYSLAPVAKRLSELLGQPVKMADDVVGESAKALTANMAEGEIVLLENVRFHAEETKNDPAFSKKLASLADVFVNDAFGTAHRAHCSTAGVADYLPAAAGFLIQKEIEVMGGALEHAERPFVAILGGAKVKDKIGVINNLLNKVDTIIIGGGMAYTFAKAMGGKIGDSLVDDERLDYAREVMELAKQKGVALLLPTDTVIADAFANDANQKVCKTGEIPDGWEGLDIGPETTKAFTDAIKNAKTVIWNGPMGVFEFENFAKGTIAIAKAVAEADAVTIIGGGDSAAAITNLGFADKMTHISTGGGASLEFLEGIVLPGVACCMEKGRVTVAAGNWKMNKTPSEAKALIEELAPLVKDAKNKVIVCPTAVCLPAVLEAAKGTNILVGAQNMYFEDKGAFTGEISADMLLDLGVQYVILGHSERRQYFAETDETVNKKVLKAFEKGLLPIICVGESLEQREQGITADLVRMQVKIALNGVTAEQDKNVIIAYEPIWAIGTGKTATTEQAEEVCKTIRDCVCELYGSDAAEAVTIQYGGSVNAKNSAELFAQPDIDGGLVGGASLKAQDFSVIANS